jgi:hypothetical protein
VSAHDLYQNAVKQALVKDGWTITDDPLILAFGRTNVYVDLGAELPFAAEKGGRRIAVEVKTFLGMSEVVDLERALGQFTLYRFVLRRQQADRTLYLAMSERAYNSVFGEREVQELLAAEGLKLLVFSPTEEVIVQWIE